MKDHFNLPTPDELDKSLYDRFPVACCFAIAMVAGIVITPLVFLLVSQ